MEAIILAAGLGSRLNAYTRETSKCLLEIGGQSILQRMVNILLDMEITKIYIVVGHAAVKVINAVHDLRVQYIVNDRYATTNSIVSMACVLPFINGPFLSLPCDLLFEPALLERFLEKKSGIVMAVDQDSPFSASATKVSLMGETIVKVSKRLEQFETDGEITGMQAFYGEAVDIYKKSVFRHVSQGNTHWLNSDVINDMIINSAHQVTMADITGYSWCEVDNEEDLYRARRIFGKENLIQMEL
jgi:choline kinase